MTSGYGSENVVFVPAERRLEITDVYRWRRVSVDVPATTVRLREHAFQHLDSEIERMLGSLKRRKDLEREVVAEARVNARRFQSGLRSAQANRVETSSADVAVGGGMRWWVRLTDRPAESFFTEDYEEASDPPEGGMSRPLYGSCIIEMADEAEIPFPADGENSAFEWILPRQDSFVEEEVPLHEPLPVLEEFCGEGGSSANGRTINLTCRGEPVSSHTACCPIRTVGEDVYATLYFASEIQIKHRVLLAVPEERINRAAGVLKASRFTTGATGPNWSIHEREGDVVHLYRDLEGRESTGFPVIPGLIVVAAAAGKTDPAIREVLLNTLLETSRAPV